VGQLAQHLCHRAVRRGTEDVEAEIADVAVHDHPPCHRYGQPRRPDRPAQDRIPPDRDRHILTRREPVKAGHVRATEFGREPIPQFQELVAHHETGPLRRASRIHLGNHRSAGGRHRQAGPAVLHQSERDTQTAGTPVLEVRPEPVVLRGGQVAGVAVERPGHPPDRLPDRRGGVLCPVDHLAQLLELGRRQGACRWLSIGPFGEAGLSHPFGGRRGEFLIVYRVHIVCADQAVHDAKHLEDRRRLFAGHPACRDCLGSVCAIGLGGPRQTPLGLGGCCQWCGN